MFSLGQMYTLLLICVAFTYDVGQIYRLMEPFPHYYCQTYMQLSSAFDIPLKMRTSFIEFVISVMSFMKFVFTNELALVRQAKVTEW